MNWLLIYLSLPANVLNAAEALVSHGVNEKKLYRLLTKPKRGRRKTRKKGPTTEPGKRGAPNKSRDTVARLLFSVDDYKATHPEATTDKAAIEALLNQSADRNKLSRTNVRQKHLSRLQKKLSRHRVELRRKPASQ